MTHVPGPWPSMRERKSCGCCQSYERSRICAYYPVCKGGNDGAAWWVYSEKVEEMTKAENRLRERLWELGLEQSVL